MSSLFELMSQLKKDWEHLQISLKQFESTLSQLIGDSAYQEQHTPYLKGLAKIDSAISTTNLANLIDEDDLDNAQATWSDKVVLILKEVKRPLPPKTIKSLFGKAGFYRQGESYKSQNRKIQASLSYLKRRRVISRNEQGMYYLVKDKDNNNTEENIS